ncbi:uncharacterized protein LOC113378898 [Ctenocephalides felis]|uniref:uncharacterized protein LOC113378898 n=1 Tax=Ctenocephalides felis TaxID=7515 RepID=UPI000E6E5405|nr:uncharacterized protein LOC113378898 [Ctenocephalides felis]
MHLRKDRLRSKTCNVACQIDLDSSFKPLETLKSPLIVKEMTDKCKSRMIQASALGLEPEAEAGAPVNVENPKNDTQEVDLLKIDKKGVKTDKGDTGLVLGTDRGLKIDHCQEIDPDQGTGPGPETGLGLEIDQDHRITGGIEILAVLHRQRLQGLQVEETPEDLNLLTGLYPGLVPKLDQDHDLEIGILEDKGKAELHPRDGSANRITVARECQKL